MLATILLSAVLATQPRGESPTLKSDLITLREEYASLQRENASLFNKLSFASLEVTESKDNLAAARKELVDFRKKVSFSGDILFVLGIALVILFVWFVKKYRNVKRQLSVIAEEKDFAQQYAKDLEAKISPQQKHVLR
jgi:hypothetical protein